MMIDENETFRLFGYYSTDLSPKSKSKVAVICECGNVRIVQKRNSDRLCKSCSMKKRYENLKEREKQRDRQLKRYEDPEEKIRTSKDVRDHHLEHPETSIKMSKSHLEYYKNHPERSITMSKSHLKRNQGYRWNNQVDNFIDGNLIVDWVERPSRHHGVTYEDYDIWRHTVYERDNYTCRICGVDCCEVHAHHIIPQRMNQDLILEISNGITMCRKCHELTYNREELFIDELQMIINNNI